MRIPKKTIISPVPTSTSPLQVNSFHFSEIAQLKIFVRSFGSVIIDVSFLLDQISTCDFLRILLLFNTLDPLKSLFQVFGELHNIPLVTWGNFIGYFSNGV